MPGFTTHYLFGLNTYKKLDPADPMKKNISAHHAPYSLGLQGPDIFFYFLPSYLIYEENPGSLAHISRINKFLRYLLKSAKLFPDQEESDIAKAYIMGFLGHYILDSKCHPYVYAKTHFTERSSKYYGSHINLEVDIDTELLAFYKHKYPSAFRQESTIVLTKPQIDTIANVLYYAYSKTYPELNIKYRTIRLAIRSMQLGTRLLRDPHGKKKILVRKIESIFIGFPVLSPMIASRRIRFYLDPLNVLHNTWCNPWAKDKVSTQSFFDLLASAEKKYMKILDQSYHALESGNTESMNALLKSLGNRSYHSGLDSSIPS